MNELPLSPTEAVQLALDSTPARVLVGRAGSSYRTSTWLKLREDHATARDAVRAEVDLLACFGADRVARYQLFDARTRAHSKTDFLQRPDLGRRLDDESRALIQANCPAGVELQVVIGDGLSATAVAVQAPVLLDRLLPTGADRGWSCGRPFLVHHCRVGVMNDVGDLLAPSVVVLLIGERPGLATAESLSAYMAYRPRAGQTDANRNLISNIHARGIGIDDATSRIVRLAEQFHRAGRSGIGVHESQAQALGG
jgi:ethanolamine ammonia-lyase small subunit